jgi:hypothetical protein
MPEIVTGNTDALAAEYVLGTLDPEERTQAQGLLESDQDFAAKVRLWERRLGELHLMVEPVEPDGKIWERIKGKMPEPIPAPETSVEPAIPPPAGDSPPAAPAPEPTPSLPSPEAPLAATSSGGLPPTPTLPPPLPPAPVPSPAAATTVAPPAPTPAATTPPPTPAPKPPAAPVLTPGGKRTSDVEPKTEPRKDQAALMKGRLSRWRVFAVLLLLLVLAVAALLSAWRFVPERVPPVLQPAEVLRVIGVTVAGSAAPRRPAPPESQFDE